MNTINVNGKTFHVPNARSISVVNDKIYVDGKLFNTEEDDSKKINIVIDGNVDSISVESCDKIEIIGDVNCHLEAGGSVTVGGSVYKDVQAGGSLKCGDIGGNVNCMGSVNCRVIKGSITAFGSITRG